MSQPSLMSQASIASQNSDLTAPSTAGGLIHFSYYPVNCPSSFSSSGHLQLTTPAEAAQWDCLKEFCASGSGQLNAPTDKLFKKSSDPGGVRLLKAGDIHGAKTWGTATAGIEPAEGG